MKFVFFFQAEDGIRDYKVTGVQTCALPILNLDCSSIWFVRPWEGHCMSKIRRFLTPAALLAAAGLLTATAFADDMVSFATGGYAPGLRTMEMMHMIDANKDGMVSKDEWMAYQQRVFKALDKDGDGSLDTKEFYGHPMPVSFATAGYSHGLETKQMFGKIDANGDGKVLHDEYIAFQVKVFEMMVTKKAHELRASDFIVNTH